ncbi:MAG: nucleotidyltransferase family protein [Candidatus Brockarchaeota archaeon]|nr:nucleotidyltransferase family protein [Candidatus Brockarchaeota archaeon]
MRVIVPAGGFAKRLQHLGVHMAKPLVKVCDKPIIDYTMEKISVLNPSEIIITVNRKFEKDFREWLGSRGYVNTRLHVEGSTREEEKPGTILSLAMLVDKIEQDEYLVVAGDNLFSLDLKEFLGFYHSKNAPVVALYDVENIELVKMYSCVKLAEDGRIVDFVEKPVNPASTMIATAIYMFPWESLVKIKRYVEEGGHRDSPGYFVSWLCRNEPVYGYVFHGYWFDIGTPQTYEEACRFMEDLKK